MDVTSELERWNAFWAELAKRKEAREKFKGDLNLAWYNIARGRGLYAEASKTTTRI